MNVDARTVRIALLVVVVVLLAPLAVDFATSGDETPVDQQSVGTQGNSTTPTPSTDQQAETDTRSNSSSESGANVTPTGDRERAQNFEATGHLAYVVDAQGPGQLTVVNRSTGNLIFKTEKYDLYHDVDPSPEGKYTLMHTSSNISGVAICPERLKPRAPCTENVIERVNYSTGETEVLYSKFVNYNGSSNWHDVDRISATEFIVADIQFDRVYVINTTTEEKTWMWNASAEFNRSTGGRKNDWTHLNDVEVINESLYMVNLRNQDQVVFVHREKGMLEDWTLGEEDNYDVLYEQHNTDYIPEERGGPAILVADSENNRIVEYQRRNGSWERTWLWTDATLQWPRDADRLPNNNTLITDTHGTRLLEVAPDGTILWKRQVPRGVYEAELLSTGPESEGGYSMALVRSEAKRTDVSAVGGIGGTVQKTVLGIFPPLVLHGFLFVLPTWVSPFAGALLLLDIVVVVLWGTGEGARFAYLRLRDEDD